MYYSTCHLDWIENLVTEISNTSQIIFLQFCRLHIHNPTPTLAQFLPTVRYSRNVLQRNVLCSLFTPRSTLCAIEYVPSEVEEVVSMESALISDERLSDIRVPFAPVVATAGYAQALNRQAGVGKASEGKVCRTSTKMLAQSHQRLPKHIII